LRARRILGGAALLVSATAAPLQVGAEEPPFHLAGSLGNVQFVVIDEANAHDTAFYPKVIQAVCVGSPSCFVRFYTNSRHVPLTFPLPDEVLAEPAAMFSASAKALRYEMRYACRLGLSEPDCY